MEREKKKHPILLTLLTLPLCLLVLAAVCCVALGVRMQSGDAPEIVIEPLLSDGVFDYTNNAVAELLGEMPYIRKIYVLDNETTVAPEPNQSLFGETDDPEVIGGLIKQAAELLEGQEMLWSPELPLVIGTKYLYYLDESIFTLTWIQEINGCAYTITEVKIAHPSQFRRCFVDETYNSRSRVKPDKIAAEVNAVAAISGDYYANRKHGIVVYSGELYRSSGDYTDTCFVDSSGDMHMVMAGTMKDDKTVQKYIDENDIQFSLCFGPALISDGKPIDTQVYELGEINDYYQRAAIGQIDKLHYVSLTVNEKPYGGCQSRAMTVMGELTKMGVQQAYMLDGGFTGTIIVNDKIINPQEFSEPRGISDLLYFATAIPDDAVKTEGSAVDGTG